MTQNTIKNSETELFKLHITKDYSQFSTFKFNRSTCKNNIAKLTKSIGQYNLISPIVVTEEGKIIDGQNRFEALKNLNMPIHYVIRKCSDKILPIIITAQTGSKWTALDHAIAYSEIGYEVYKKLIDIYEYWKDDLKKINYKFPNIPFGKIVCAYTGYNTDAFENGAAILYEDFGNKLMNLLKRIIILYHHDLAYLGSINIKALRLVMKKNKDFNCDHFIESLKKHKLHLFLNTKDQKKQIIRIYNINALNKQKIN